ncbi:MAG: HgcAB-associated protein [Dehalococcoidales bacterium]|jgi:AbrB family looped-hinge helix DNA binding protein
MAAKKKTDTQPECCSGTCCKVDSIVTVDERGQVLLPKDTREKAEIHAGDKLALMSWEKDGKICCFMLIKAQELAGMAKEVLGPLAKEIF